MGLAGLEVDLPGKRAIGMDVYQLALLGLVEQLMAAMLVPLH